MQYSHCPLGGAPELHTDRMALQGSKKEESNTKKHEYLYISRRKGWTRPLAQPAVFLSSVPAQQW